MTEIPVQIRDFDPVGANDDAYAALNRHLNRTKAEKFPDDPPVPLEQTMAEYRNIPPFVTLQGWAGWDGGEIVATAVVVFLHTDTNAHLAQFDINVEPEYRRRGIGRALLRRVVEIPRREGKRLMITTTHGRALAGGAFMERLGAERGIEMHSNQLVLAELDRAQIDRWQAEARQHAAEFTPGFWDGPYPEDQMEAIVALVDMYNTVPRDNLDVEDMHFTADQLRQMEQTLEAQKIQRWTLYLSEATTGRFAGFTEVTWNPSQPKVVHQGFTGIAPEFRGKQLGKWLKAAMLDRILRERPEARFVRTGNADSNAAMLGINRALGFRPYTAEIVWQVETEKVAAYLDL